MRGSGRCAATTGVLRGVLPLLGARGHTGSSSSNPAGGISMGGELGYAGSLAQQGFPDK